MNLLDPQNIEFQRTETGIFNCAIENDKTYENIFCVPLFPLSDPDNFISINITAEFDRFKEIGIIEDLNDLPSEQQDIIKDIIRIRYLIPEIINIRKIIKKPGLYEWDVITDRGEKIFFFHYSHENISVTDKKIIIITDIHKCRYKISSIKKLPSKAQSELDKIIL